MKLSAFLTALFLSIPALFSAIYAQESSQPAENKILAGYYPDWGIWNKHSYIVDLVPYDRLTHVIWSFVSPNADGSLRGDAISDPEALDAMVSRAHAAHTKVILSLGGAGLCENFAAVAADDVLREKFVTELMAFVDAHNLDGLDMDWEFSSVPVASEDTIAYNKLLKDIRNALPQGKTLSAALPCSDYYGKYFTAEVLLENLDWFGLMTYDITGDWDDKARFNSPLLPNSKWTTWSWKQAAAYWKKRGVSDDKMVFGIPAYGFVFYGATGPGSAFDKGATEYTSYTEILEMADWNFFYDDVSKEPYGISGDMFATFENEQSVSEKAAWILSNGYAGAMVWELSQDYTEDSEQPLIGVLAASLIDGTIPDKIERQRPRISGQGKARYLYNALGQFRHTKDAQGNYFQRNR